jgi:hypothetical protein
MVPVTVALVMFAVSANTPPQTAAAACSDHDVGCLRALFQQSLERDARQRCAQPRPMGVPCDDEMGTPLEPAPSWGLPMAGVGTLQWCATVGTDLLPACWFTVAAVVLLLPASTIPMVAVTLLGCGVLPCLPCLQGVATNLVGDLVSPGSQRGKLVVQMLVGMATLGLQVGTGLVGALVTGLFVNYLVVTDVVPQTRLLAASCSPSRRDRECTQQLWNVTSSTGRAALAVTVGAMATVVTNLGIALVLKGPLLAVAYAIHAEERLPQQTRFLPRLAATETPKERVSRGVNRTQVGSHRHGHAG